MRIVITIMLALTMVISLGAFKLISHTPPIVATAVIAEKPGKIVGGQIATLLPADLTERQSYLLTTAYATAKAEGFRNPEVIQSILLQETHAGGLKVYKVANPGPQAYFGVGQIKLAAARDVLSRYPDLYQKFGFHTRTDDEIKANLILNDEFNITIMTKYVKMLQTQYGYTGRQLVNAYNRGPGGVHAVDDNFHYAVGAERKLAQYKGRL